MADHEERVRTLLRAASEVPDRPEVPVGRLVAAGRRSVRRRRIATAALTACAIAGVVVVPTLVITNKAHRITATGPTDSATPSPGTPTTTPTGTVSESPTGTATPAPLPTTSAYPAEGPGTATALAHAKWSTLPNAPIAGRRDPAAVWTGTQMLMWGGESDSATLGDGASFDPSTRTWRVLPAAPLTRRAGIASVWTGTQWFLWGGNNGLEWAADGALYDPATGVWTALPPSPLSARGGATAVWTGTEVIVVGGSWGSGVSHSPADGAAYSPATGRWRLLAANSQVPAHDLMYVTATPIGANILVAFEWSKNDAMSITSGVELSLYDPGRDAWTPVTNAEPHESIGQLIWTGREVLVPAGQIWCGVCPGPPPNNSNGRRLDAANGTWRKIPHGPLDDSTPVDVWTGSALVATPGDSAAWDATTNKWTALPHSPYLGYAPVSLWTGRELLVWGLDGSSSTKAAGASLG